MGRSTDRLRASTKEWWPSVAFLGLFALAVEVLARTGSVPRVILPPVSDVAGSISGMGGPFFLRHLGMTAFESVVGFAIGAAAGLGIGVMMYYSRVLERLLYPIVVTSKAVPVVAMAPLLTFWLGYDVWAKTLMAALVSYFPVTVGTVSGLKYVDEDLTDLVRSFGANEWVVFTEVRLRAALPNVFASLKVGSVLSVVGSVVGEMAGSTGGLGYLLLSSIYYVDVASSAAVCVVMAGLGLSMFASVSLLERKIIYWRPGADNGGR